MKWSKLRPMSRSRVAAIGLLTLFGLLSSSSVRNAIERQLIQWSPDGHFKRTLGLVNLDPKALPVLLETMVGGRRNETVKKSGSHVEERGEAIRELTYELILKRLSDSPSTFQEQLSIISKWKAEHPKALAAARMLEMLCEASDDRVSKIASRGEVIELARLALGPGLRIYRESFFIPSLCDLGIRLIDLDQEFAGVIEELAEDDVCEAMCQFEAFRDALEAKREMCVLGPKFERALLRLMDHSPLNFSRFLGAILRGCRPYDFDERAASMVFRSSNRRTLWIDELGWRDSCDRIDENCEQLESDERESFLAEHEVENEFSFDPTDKSTRALLEDRKATPSAVLRPAAEQALPATELGKAMMDLGDRDPSDSSWWLAALLEIESPYEFRRLAGWTRLGGARVPYPWIARRVQVALKSGSSLEKQAAVFALGCAVGSDKCRERTLRGLLGEGQDGLLRAVIAALGRLPVSESRDAFEWDQWLLRTASLELRAGRAWIARDCTDSISHRFKSVRGANAESLESDLLSILSQGLSVSPLMIEGLLPLIRLIPTDSVRDQLRPHLMRDSIWVAENDLFGFFVDVELKPAERRRLEDMLIDLRLRCGTSCFPGNWLRVGTARAYCRGISGPIQATSLFEWIEYSDNEVLFFKILEEGDEALRAKALSQMTYRANEYGETIRVSESTVGVGEVRKRLEASLEQSSELSCQSTLSMDYVFSDLSPERVQRLASIFAHKARAGLNDWRFISEGQRAELEPLRRALLSELRRSPGARPELAALAADLLEHSPETRASLSRAVQDLLKLRNAEYLRKRLEGLLAAFDGAWDQLIKDRSQDWIEDWIEDRMDRRAALHEDPTGRADETTGIVALLAPRQPRWTALAALHMAAMDSAEPRILELAERRLLESCEFFDAQREAQLLRLAELSPNCGALAVLLRSPRLNPATLLELREVAEARSDQADDRRRMEARLVLFEQGADSSIQPRGLAELSALVFDLDDSTLMRLVQTLARSRPGSPILSLALQKLISCDENPEIQREAMELISSGSFAEELKLLAQRAAAFQARFKDNGSY